MPAEIAKVVPVYDAKGVPNCFGKCPSRRKNGACGITGEKQGVCTPRVARMSEELVESRVLLRQLGRVINDALKVG